MNRRRFWDYFHRLQDIGRKDNGVFRVAWTDEDMLARRELAEILTYEGFTAFRDGAGNVWGLWTPKPGQEYLVLGSHLDSVAGGGDFDGVYGVAAALETLLSLRECQFGDYGNVAIVAFADEEGVRFNSGLLGSRAITGALTRQEFMTMADASGNHSLEDAAAAYGVTWESLSAIRPVPICAYLEIHVEQGPILEERQIPLGIVNVIAGRSQGYVRFTGRQNHAGTTPMDKRQDALLAAAQAVVGLHEAVMDHECVGTVGDIIADPGSPNVIAGHSAISFDVRAPKDDIREAVLRRWQASWAAGAIVQRVDKAAVALDLTIRNILSDAAARLQIPTMFLNSWAVHDAMILAQSVPSGLLFIPSAAGVSHARDEWSSPQDCEIGVMVFEEAARTILTGT